MTSRVEVNPFMVQFMDGVAPPSRPQCFVEVGYATPETILLSVTQETVQGDRKHTMTGCVNLTHEQGALLVQALMKHLPNELIPQTRLELEMMQAWCSQELDKMNGAKDDA